MHQDRVIEVPVERIIEVPPPVQVVPVKKIGLGVLLHRSTQSKGLTYVEDIIPVTNTDIPLHRIRECEHIALVGIS